MPVYNARLIRKIAESMAAGSSEVTTIPSGYTYLGQMISHDIVPVTNRLAATRQETPFLNLDSLYGSAPPYILQFAPEKSGVLDAKGLFCHDERRSPNRRGVIHDFCRTEQQGRHIAMIPESRNDENIILSQFQVLWQRFHNKLLHEEWVANALEARQVLVLIFQFVTVKEFLRSFLKPEVYQAYFQEGKSYYPMARLNRIPAYFSHAVFRFGHSTVRPNYRLHSNHTKGLLSLIRKGRPLELEDKIDWDIFFSPETDVLAMGIDTNISSGMSDIHGGDPHRQMVNVLVRNVQAGFDADLNPGEHYYDTLEANGGGEVGLEELQKEDLEGTSLELLNEEPFEQLPLWLYILLEAQVKEHGEHLGTLGSILVAEVLRESIEQADVSIYEQRTRYSERALHKLEPLSDIIDITSAKSLILQILDFVE